jgi:predicted  nucleic acid-binding Zn-ribbon protein
MAGPAPIFRELHRLRRFAQGLQEQLARIPLQLKAHQARLAKQEQLLRDAQEHVKHLKVTASDKEKALKSMHDKIARFEKQVNDVSSKKEYDALQLEIAHAKVECGRLEDEILAALTDSEERAAALPDVEKAVAQARADWAKVEADTGPRKIDLEKQLKETQQQLRTVEATIPTTPTDLRAQYNRTIASFGADGMAAVHGRICDNCHTEITVQAANELAQEKFVVCKSCGRILYLPEGAGAAAEEEEE